MKIFIVIALIALFAILGPAIFLFAPDWLSENLKYDMGSRVGIAQLLIGISSVAALLLAAWEFQQTQKAPELRIGLEPHKSNKIIFKETDEILVTEQLKRFGDFARCPMINFKVFIDNQGNAIARWVKVTIMIIDPPENYKLSLLGDGHLDDFWRPKPNPDAHRDCFDFIGGDNYVCYSHSRKVTDVREWMDHIGNFRLVFSPNDLGSNKLVKIKCIIEANDFPRKEQVFLFREKCPAPESN